MHIVPAGPARGALRAALLLSAALFVVAAVTFFWAVRHAGEAGRRQGVPAGVAVTIRAHGCEPDVLTVAAGTTLFRIHNRSERAVEWEILDGVMVMEERENIAPGFTQSLQARLPPGDYAMTCGLIGNPRGVLHVTPTAASDAASSARPALAEYVGAMAEYRVYLAMQARALQAEVEELAGAIEAGDLARARSRYAPARQAYQRIEPVAGLFGDLDTRIDGQADYFALRERDPAFTGFHRIEYGLFAARSLAGMPAVAQALLADVRTLRARLDGLTVEPDRMLAGSAALARDMAQIKLSGSEERHARTELWDVQANLQGTRKVADLLAPFVLRVDRGLAARIRQDLEQAEAAFARQWQLAQPGGQRPAEVPQAWRQALAPSLLSLAEDFAQARARISPE